MTAFRWTSSGRKTCKALLDFLDLVADFFFDVGSFVDLVTDVNVHFRASNAGVEPREAAVLTRELYTRWEGVEATLRRLWLSYSTYFTYTESCVDEGGLDRAWNGRGARYSITRSRRATPSRKSAGSVIRLSTRWPSFGKS